MYSARISIKLHGQWYWKSINNWENVTLIIVTRMCIIQSCILSSTTLWGLISFEMKSAAMVRLLIQYMSLQAAVSLRQRQKLSERILHCASLPALGEWLIEFFGDCKNYKLQYYGCSWYRKWRRTKKDRTESEYSLYNWRQTLLDEEFQHQDKLFLLLSFMNFLFNLDAFHVSHIWETICTCARKWRESA